jgi:hypothetical protein
VTQTAHALTSTREALHQVAEHVLAAAQYAQTGTVRLRVVDGGFRTTRELHGGTRLAVIGGRLVVTDGSGERSAPLTTIAAAAEFAGITPGLPAEAYGAATRFAPDVPLLIDPGAVRLLTDWYGLGEAALRLFSADVGASQQPTLWPEHFDLGITVDEVNYGASPGDAHVARPYLYVGPHGGPPRRDAFWNADFGAVRTIDEIAGVETAVAFFRRGRAAL